MRPSVEGFAAPRYVMGVVLPARSLKFLGRNQADRAEYQASQWAMRIWVKTFRAPRNWARRDIAIDSVSSTGLVPPGSSERIRMIQKLGAVAEHAGCWASAPLTTQGASRYSPPERGAVPVPCSRVEHRGRRVDGEYRSLHAGYAAGRTPRDGSRGPVGWRCRELSPAELTRLRSKERVCERW
jgi:hypothetical protein